MVVQAGMGQGELQLGAGDKRMRRNGEEVAFASRLMIQLGERRSREGEVLSS